MLKWFTSGESYFTEKDEENLDDVEQMLIGTYGGFIFIDISILLINPYFLWGFALTPNYKVLETELRKCKQSSNNI